MMISNAYLMIFAVAFMGCVLATPVVTRIAVWAGAIDKPDQFRRVHKGATPRMGGLGLAFGIALGLLTAALGAPPADWSEFEAWRATLLPIACAGLIVLLIGAVDDSKEMSPRVKLLGQGAAVLVLYMGGIRVHGLNLLGFSIDLSRPTFELALAGGTLSVALPSLLATTFWFLACMNIWNLIDGMDGLASGVGLLVSGTLMLVAIHQDNLGVAILAASLAGSLAGFLLYNWHPACIFLGDSGSLLIGLLIGVIGVQGSLKGPSTISILFPILAMGLPISDTAMAIFRRWVRNLPLSSADRRHVHHLLIGLGLNPAQAALLLYCFSGFLCGVVMIGVAFNNEVLALVLGISGCLAFLLILTSRRDELACLRGDLQSRLVRGRQERFAAKVTWEAIQRIELCETPDRVHEIVADSARKLGCDSLRVECFRRGESIFRREVESLRELNAETPVSGPTATFRLDCGDDLEMAVSLHQDSESSLEADIAFRFLQRLSLATAERVGLLMDREESPVTATDTAPRPAAPRVIASQTPAAEPREILAVPAGFLIAPVWTPLNRLRSMIRGGSGTMPRHPSLTDE
ncbi:MraY family glycosyltransferase [Isosphaeraceae bacterium EP7]